MKQEIDKTSYGSQTAKERETVRQLCQAGFYLTIIFVLLIAVILYLVL